MKVWTKDSLTLDKALRAVNMRYEGNLKVLTRNVTIREQKRGGFVLDKVRISVHAARVRGGRRRASNLDHAVSAACWHAYRDFILALFHFGATRVKSARADYRSLEGFREQFEDTGYSNIGSQFNPVQYREACDCAADGNYIGEWQPEVT